MKKTSILAIAILLPIIASAQNKTGKWTIYPRLGQNWSKISGDKIYYKDNESVKGKNKTGLTAGVEVWWQASAPLAVSAGALYSNEGSKYPTIHSSYTNEKQQKVTETIELKYNTHMLNIPLLLHAFLFKGFSIETGLQPGFLINARTKEHYQTETSYEAIKETSEGKQTYMAHDVNERTEKADITEHFNKFQLSIPIGVSYEYENVQLDVRYNYGLTKTGEWTDNGHNRSLMLSVAYGIEL